MRDIWVYAEDVETPTRIRITVDRDALYDVELEDSLQLSVLESLMRSYEGIFSFTVPIDEEYVASRCGVGVPQLRQILYRLSIGHVIVYVPCEEADVLVLHDEHLAQGNVRLSPLRYRQLKKSWHRRMETMVSYVSQEDECRSRFLLRYFGQEDSENCGHCDICRARAAAVAGTDSAPGSGISSGVRPASCPVQNPAAVAGGASGIPATSGSGEHPDAGGASGHDVQPRSSGMSAESTAAALKEFVNGECAGKYSLKMINERFGNPAADYSPDYLSVLRELIDIGEVPPCMY